MLRVVVGQHARGRQWEKVHAAELLATVEGALRDRGEDRTSATVAVKGVAEGFAQAQLLRDLAFQRTIQLGGPLTDRGKARRAFQVWLLAMDRVERHAKLLGLDRKEKRIDPFEASRQAVAEARR